MLTYKNGRIEVRPTDLLIRTFLEAYAQDTSEEKDEAHKLFAYIHLRSQIDPEAPFFRVSQFEIDAVARYEIYKDRNYNWEDSIYTAEQVADMVKEYQYAYSTPGDRMLKSFDRKIDEMRKLADDTKPIIKENFNEKTQKTEFTTNTKMISDTLLSVDKLMEARDKMVAKLKNQEDSGTVRGQQAPSLLEKKLDSK